MSIFTVTGVIRENDWTTVQYRDETGYEWSHAFPDYNLATLIAEYDLDDEAQALDVLLHDPHANAWIGTLAARDDPAVAQGWVTDEAPDAEPVHLYNARSTFDARGAHLARIAALKKQTTFEDPDGHLQAFLAADRVVPEHFQNYAEHVDVHRWRLVYGSLPDAPYNTEEAPGA